MTTKGTKEWADSNVNIYNGCSNNCIYCYARQMAIRFKRKTKNNWKIMKPNLKTMSKGFKKRKGRIMFPTSHDITKENLDQCIIILNRLLQSKNNVLITTKPDPDCIKNICNLLYHYKKQIQFRFTITSMNDETLQLWEPDAPLFKNRMKALNLAHEMGFKTSISIEPFLDFNPISLILKVQDFVTETIWIGPMNNFRTKNTRLKQIKVNYTKDNLLLIQYLIKNNENIQHKKIRYKDAFINKIERK